MNQFPAVAIGGPPHSGKSVLTYGLTQRLRERNIDHYVLRACPDGEGDWSQEAPPETVRLIRNKSPFSRSFVEGICRDLNRRHLPLLVDVGGRPTPEQEAIFDHCTHAILIAPEATASTELPIWRDLAIRHGLAVLAELRSALTGQEQIQAHKPVLQARVVGLERHRPVGGPVVDALATRLAALFHYEESELRLAHLSQSPLEMTVEVDRLAQDMGLGPLPHTWQPEELPAVLEYLPQGESLALYGRGPAWLYAATAIHVAPASLFQFDPRLGWVQPSTVRLQVNPAAHQPLRWQVVETADHICLELRLVDAYVDYSEARELALPSIPADRGLVISGRLPYWLLTGVVTAYRGQPWLATYRPQLDDQAVVVASRLPARPVGSLIQMPTPGR